MDNLTLSLVLALGWLILLRPVAKSIFKEEGEAPPMFILVLNLVAIALLLNYALVWAAQEVLMPSGRRLPVP